jgi:[acyl-carrier-protein] S-malonyltransferase
MLSPWLDVPGVAARLHWAAAVTGLDLVRIGTTGSADDVRDTAVAQPLLVALALATAQEILDRARVSNAALPAVVAGHSVGEYAAASLAGALSPETALVLVRERGRLMAAASAREPTGMSAVLGGNLADVTAALGKHDLSAANVNADGQVVAAGRLDALAAFAAEPPDGSRVRPLQVAGAFHTEHMADARDGLAEIAIGAPRRDPRATLLGNGDGAIVSHGDDVLRRLVDQVASPVRWDSCMRTLVDLGVTTVIELPPAGTLAGLVRREMPGVETLAVKSPADLDAAAALLERQVHLHTEVEPAWRIAVAPVAGTFRPRAVSPGMHVSPGQPMGTVVSNRSEATVSAAHGGVLVEWLAEDGDPVAPGQAVARLHPLSEQVGV